MCVRRLQSHWLPHQTLKWSLGRPQRQFCQFPSRLWHHDLFSSLTFSPAAEFGLVLTHLMSVHCIFPLNLFYNNDNMEAYSYRTQKRPHLKSWYFNPIKYFFISNFLLRMNVELLIFNQIDWCWFLMYTWWRKASSVPFKRDFWVELLTSNLLRNQL